MALAYLTSNFPGIGGKIKQRPADFMVQEIAAYEPSGDGEHAICEIEKTGLTTHEAIRRLAKAVGFRDRDVGYAGLKDAQAVTRQHLSFQLVPPEKLMAVKADGVTVLWVDQHKNKLRLGHTRGNRFTIKLREVDPMKVVTLRPMLDRLQRDGMPNYFGEQRFGQRDNNDTLGLLWLRGDAQALLNELLGGDQDEAREAFSRGDIEAAHQLWPGTQRMELILLEQLRRGASADEAVRKIDRKLTNLWTSAAQSRVFNEVVSERIGTLGRLLDGDIAYLHDRGACFAVDDASAEQPRADRFEISPTGPMPGGKMLQPTGTAAAIEHRVMQTLGVLNEQFSTLTGERRPLRVQPDDIRLSAGTDEHGPYITFAFTLPPGAFATSLMREIIKQPDAETAGS